MTEYHFDSVDSTAWLLKRGGFVYMFDGKTQKRKVRRKEITVMPSPFIISARGKVQIRGGISEFSHHLQGHGLVRIASINARQILPWQSFNKGQTVRELESARPAWLSV